MMRIYELPPTQAARVRPLYEAAWFDEACYEAVFAGWNPARIFVDDPVQPRAALMARSYEYFIAGDPDTALTQFINDAPFEVQIFDRLYAYVPIGSAWDAALTTVHPLERVGRRNYRWRPDTPILDWRARLAALADDPAFPAPPRLVDIDEALARRADSDPALYPVPFILYFWTDYGLYARHGFGKALLIGDQIACTVFALCTSARDAIISIDTLHRYHRRGLGLVTASAFIEETIGRGLLPVWDCDEDNPASWGLAERLGFTAARPFYELAMPDRAPLTVSHGLWSRSGEAWVRAE